MRKLMLLSLVAVLALLPLSSVAAQGDPAILATEYVLAQQNEDGSFGEEGVLTFTSLSLLALAASGECPTRRAWP
ncbi:MAG: hypothetical protein HC915_19295, partial [Anaerolineae bacterium]|nr:hypothetical protein [Anaerolineae bacterium]